MVNASRCILARRLHRSFKYASPSGFTGACRSGFCEWPFGSGKPSTDSENRTTRLLGEICAARSSRQMNMQRRRRGSTGEHVRTSAFFTEHIAFRTASATSLRTAAFRHVFGSHVICGRRSTGHMVTAVCCLLRGPTRSCVSMG